MTRMLKLGNSLPPTSEPFKGETLIADGWVYRDIPSRLSYEFWDRFIDLLGEGNYRIMAVTTGPDWKRGQFLISPEGMNNLATYNAKNKP